MVNPMDEIVRAGREVSGNIIPTPIGDPTGDRTGADITMLFQGALAAVEGKISEMNSQGLMMRSDVKLLAEGYQNQHYQRWCQAAQRAADQQRFATPPVPPAPRARR